MKRKRPLSPRLQAAVTFLRQQKDALVFGLDAEGRVRCHSTLSSQARLILVFESEVTGKCQVFAPGYSTMGDAADRLEQVVSQLRLVQQKADAEAAEIPPTAGQIDPTPSQEELYEEGGQPPDPRD